MANENIPENDWVFEPQKWNPQHPHLPYIFHQHDDPWQPSHDDFAENNSENCFSALYVVLICNFVKQSRQYMIDWEAVLVTCGLILAGSLETIP
jgi:hypothetical protein